MTQSAQPSPFQIRIGEADQKDLRSRILQARLPDQQQGVAWEQGISVHYLQVHTLHFKLDIKMLCTHACLLNLKYCVFILQGLIDYWGSEFNWSKQEAWINSHFRQFELQIGDIDLHFVHHPSDDPNAVPLLMVHGCPGSFLDYHKLILKLQQNSKLPLSDYV